MVKVINPDSKSFKRREVIKQLPAVNQTETLQKFFGATVDNLFQPGQSAPVNGYIGQKPHYYKPDQETYLKEMNSAREFYQLEPAVVSVDNSTSDITNLMFYQDLINYLRFNGANVSNHNRLFEQDYYSWCPPIDLDKLLNYREYYWIKEGPDTKDTLPSITHRGDGQSKRYALPVARLATDDVLDITVSVNGQKLDHGVSFSLSTTEVNFYVIPAQDSVITITAYVPMSVGDISGHETFAVPAGFLLSSGMKIRLHTKEAGPSYSFQDYIVEGVGKSIRLLPDNTTTTQDIIPHAQYGGDDITTVFALPVGDNTHGVLVRVDDTEMVTGLHYEETDSGIQFYKNYVPKDKSKVEIWLLKPINIGNIIGQNSFMTPLHTQLSNGMKIRFVGTIHTLIPPVGDTFEEWSDKAFFVSGVGKAIKLTIDDGFQNGLDFKDYFVMERGSNVGNPWSQGNRWFHRDVIDFSKIDNTIVAQQAKRPIVEFEQNLELFHYGRTRREDIAAICLTGSSVIADGTSLSLTNLFVQLNGKSSIVIDGTTLKHGMRVLFTTDKDDLINNRVFLVTSTLQGTLRFTMETDGSGEAGSPVLGEIMRVSTGTRSGKEYYWTGSVWQQAQEKTGINQVPLFQLYDYEGTPLNDPEAFPDSDFAGNAIFGYQFSPDPRKRPDPELSRRLMFSASASQSEIVFENYLYGIDILGALEEIPTTFAHPLDQNGFAKRYTYKDRQTGERFNIDGFYFHRTMELDGNDTFSNDWHSANRPSRQYVRTTFVATDSEPTFTIPMLPATSSDIIVKINNVALLPGEFRLVGDQLSPAVASSGDVFEVRVWNDSPVENDGYYEIPTNLQANPDNREVTTITRGGYYPQFSEIIANQPGLTGKAYSSNSYRDTGRNKGLGTSVVQHTAPMMKLMISSSSQDMDVMLASRYVEREYSRYRNRVIQKAEEFLRKGVMDPSVQPAEDWLVEILRTLNYGKTTEFPFALSGCGTISGEMTFIPPTPSFLGIAPITVPEIFIDESYPTPTKVIRGHDGSITIGWGDVRDSVLLAFEQRIYDSIQVKFRNAHRPIVDVVQLQDGKFRKGEYSRDEAIAIYRPMFERWAAFNGVNTRRNDQFDPTNPWTWNWSSAKDMDGQSLPGHWRGIYIHFFDTDRPHTHPWEMLGLTVKPNWWDTRYGHSPYTRGNSVLWSDLEAGYIAEGTNIGVHSAFARPGLTKIIPVDDQGNLLSPMAIGMILPGTEPSYMAASMGWETGDCGPAESVWRKSEVYSFAFAQMAFLMKPARFMELGWDTEHLVYVDNQFINTLTKNRPNAISLVMHGEVNSSGVFTHRIGVQQWISDFMKSKGQDINAKLGDVMRSLDVRLVYKVGGYTNIQNFVAIADNFDQVPTEDISVRLYRSPSITEEFYGGVIVEWNGRGWQVYGYDVLKPSFTIIPSDTNGPSTSIALGGTDTPEIPLWHFNTYYGASNKVSLDGKVYRCIRPHTSSRIFEAVYWEETTAPVSRPVIRIADYHRANLEGEMKVIPYGTEFSTQQDVYEFLVSYQRYLESRGWVFDGFDSDGRTEDFRQSGKDFLYWSLVESAVGGFIALSPLSMMVKFKCLHGTVQSIEQIINGVYSLLGKEGFPINTKNTSVTRYQNDVSVRATDQDSAIYACRLYVSELEHVVIFNNKTIFNDTIYDPVLNLRQPRLRIQAHKTIGWAGRMDAPGFIITDNVILPNYDKSAENFRRMFDVENFDEPTLQEYARANIGYRRRGYLDNLLLSPTSQFDFYQGMIRQKGSAAAMRKVLRSNHVSGGTDVRFMEEWAFRVGEYGGVENRLSLELYLRQTQVTNNPQLIKLTNQPGSEASDNRWDDVITISSSDERWIHKPQDIDLSNPDFQVFPFKNAPRQGELSLAGPVKIGETKWTFVSPSQLTDAVLKKTAFEDGDLVWLYKANDGKFDVLRYGSKTTTITAAYRSDDMRSINVILDDSSDSVLVVQDGQLIPAGIYDVSAPSLQTQNWTRNFSVEDVMPTVKTWTKIIDISQLSGMNISQEIISSSDASTIAFIKQIRLRTIENEGDNFRGMWKKSFLGRDSQTASTTITSAFGADYVGQGVAFHVGNFWGSSQVGIVNVFLNGTQLASGTFFLSPDAQYLFISSVMKTGGAVQSRAIHDGDRIDVEVLASPSIAIGTQTDNQKFFRYANSPDLINPMGIKEQYDIPYFLSFDSSNEPNIGGAVLAFIQTDGCSQGKLAIEIDAVLVLADTEQPEISLPDGATVSDITVTVKEAFDTENMFGNNQLRVGTQDNDSLFVGPATFSSVNLRTPAQHAITSNLPYVLPSASTVVVRFSQAWSQDALTKAGFVKTSNITSFDYLTTPDEYFRKVPFTYRPGTAVAVKINGEERQQFNPATDSSLMDWSNLRYNILDSEDFSYRVYFGRKLQDGTILSGAFTPKQFSVDDGNTTRVFPIPGTPQVVISRQAGDGVDTQSSKAQFVPIVGGGSLKEITMVDGGANYLSNYTEVHVLGNGHDAVVRPIIVDGVIQALVIDDAGHDFITPPSILILDTSPRTGSDRGHSASAVVSLSNSGLSGYVRVQAGSYTETPVVTIQNPTGGSGSGASAVAVLGKAGLAGLQVNNGGTGYATSTAVEILPQPVVEAVAQAWIDGDGRLAYLNITNSGSHYAIPPHIDIIGGGGTGATAEAIVNDLGQVVHMRITNYGVGYSSAPQVIVSGGSSEASPATVAALISNGVITGLNVTAPGSYLGTPTVVMNGSGSGADVTVMMEARGIAGLRVINTGDDYTGRISDTDILQIRVSQDGTTWRTLRKLPSMNEGYNVINNLIYFVKAPRFGTNAKMEIILHNAEKVERTEDVDVTTPQIAFHAATSGVLAVDINYTVKSSTMNFISGATDQTNWSDPFAELPSDGTVVTSKGFQSVVFKTISDRDSFTPEEGWKVDDRTWVLDDSANKWATYSVSSVNNGVPTWEKVRGEQPKIDNHTISHGLIYNKRTNEIETRLQLWNPAAGFLPGVADEEIWFRLDYDPAYYTNGDDTVQVDADQSWALQHVGQVWWDTSTTIFLDYEIGESHEDDYNLYRRKHWGQIAPGTSIDLYEWVKSPVHPSQWAAYVLKQADTSRTGSWYASGDVKDVNNYVEHTSMNSRSGVMETVWYFWVKNARSVPPVDFRTMPIINIASVISDPNTQDIPWFAVVDQNTIMVSGVRKFLNDSDTILQLNWKVGEKETNIHKQWLLLREDDERSLIPRPLWSKMTDSLVGWDDGVSFTNEYADQGGTIGDLTREKLNSTQVGSKFGPRHVPDTAINPVEILGTSFRPRQTWFTPESYWVNGSKVYRPSIKARKHFTTMLNRIFYLNQVSFDIDNSSFPVTTPIPLGRKTEFRIDYIGQNEFILPRDFNMENGCVYIRDISGNETIRLIAEKDVAIQGINYSVERVKINNVYYNKLIFPKSPNPYLQDPSRYDTVVVRSGDYYDVSVVDFTERDFTYTDGGIRAGHKVLVSSSPEAFGFWTIWECTADHIEGETVVPASTWKLVQAQTYDIRDFIDEADWWFDGYGPTTGLIATYDTTAHRNSALPNPSDGDVVKVRDDGTGKWIITTWKNNTWQVVGKENFIKKFSPKFYDYNRVVYAGPGYNWNDLTASSFEDIRSRDGSWELKIILNHLNGASQDNSLLTDLEANELFFSMVYFVHTQQSMVDWAFKTSYLYLGGYNEPLSDTPIQTADQSDALQTYIEEVKPYHVKLRDFVRRLSPSVDTAVMYITDFDKAPMYDEQLAKSLPENDKSLAYRPIQVLPNDDGTYAISDEDQDILQNKYWPMNVPATELGRQYWRDWLNNSGVNPHQPMDVTANPSLIRRMKTTILFDRKEEMIPDQLGDHDGTKPQVRTAGWGGDYESIGWDVPAWDNEGSSLASGAGATTQWYKPQTGMPKNDPATLIDGVDYKGTYIDGYTFQNEDVNLDIDGGQMDRAGVDSNPYDIDVDGGDFQNPYFEEGHPPELIKVHSSDSFLMSVYQNYAPGSPVILSNKLFGGKSQDGTGFWGPYNVGQYSQNHEALMVHVDGKYQREDQDYVFDATTQRIWFKYNVLAGSVINLMSITVGGGTPYQTASYEGDRHTSNFRVPQLGTQMNSRVFVYADKSNDFVSSQDGETWVKGYSTWKQHIKSIAYGAGRYVAVGDRILDIAVEKITKTGTTARVTTTKAHGLATGMTVTIRGASVSGFNGDYVIVVADDLNFTYAVPAGLASLTSGLIYVDGPSRIIYSTDMVFWTTAVVPSINNLTGITFANGFFVAVGENGSIITSSDGATWMSRTSGTLLTLTKAIYADSLNAWMIIGQGIILRSSDLSVWNSLITEAQLTIGTPIGLQGKISAKDDLQNWVSPTMRASLQANNHTGLTMGICDPMYLDENGNPLDPSDDHPYLWQVDSIEIVAPGVDAPDSPPAGWPVVLSDGKGTPCVFHVHTQNGVAQSVSIDDFGSYEVRPQRSSFDISGTGLTSLGIIPGRYMTIYGTTSSPIMLAGQKIKIGKTVMTALTDLDLPGVVTLINSKTNKHNVSAYNEGGRIKLSLPLMWDVVEQTANTLPVGVRFTVTFRPLGVPLSVGIDTLLQNLMFWKDGDLVFLNGQTNTAKNGVYRFRRGEAGSDYYLVHPTTNEVGTPNRPTFVYDSNDGIGYSLQSNGTYSQFLLNLKDAIYKDNTFIVVGARETILATTDLLHWNVVSPPDRFGYDLNNIATDGENILAIGQDGYTTKSQDGFVWTTGPRFSNFTLSGLSYGSGHWVAVGKEGVLYSSTNLTSWEEKSIEVHNDFYGIDFANSRFIAFFQAMKKQYRMMDGHDFSFSGKDVVFDATLSPLPPAEHNVVIINMGTVIQAMRHFRTKADVATVYRLKNANPPASNYMMVTLNGTIIDASQYTFTIGNDAKGDVELRLLLNAAPPANVDLTVTVFNGPDAAIVRTDSWTVAGNKKKILTGKSWMPSAWVLTDSSNTPWKLSQNPGSMFPVDGTIIVKKNGKELLPPNVIFYTADGSTANFPIIPGANPTAQFDLYVNGVVKTVTTGTSGTAHKVYDNASGKIVELVFNAGPPAAGSEIIVIVFDQNDYFVDNRNPANHQVILTAEPHDGDEYSIITFAEDTAMDVNTEVFEGSTENNFYIINHRPFNGDHIMVSVNGDLKTHMVDFTVEGLTLGGWDTFGWGGRDQYGKFGSIAINPDYTAYKNAGGKPPVWDGLNWVEGPSNATPLGTIAYNASNVLYTGPTYRYYPTTSSHQGPPGQAFSWDVIYDGGIVKFNQSHTSGDRIKVTTFGGRPYCPPVAWRSFRTTNDQWETVRIADAHKTYLADDLMATDYSAAYLGDSTDLVAKYDFEKQFGQVIRLYANDKYANEDLPHIILPVPNIDANIPGVVWIGGERIEYFEIKYLNDNPTTKHDYLVDGNGKRYLELRRLKRGSQGTPYGVPQKIFRMSTDPSYHGDRLLVTTDYLSYDLGSHQDEVFVYVNEVLVNIRSAYEAKYAPRQIDENEAFYYWIEGQNLKFNKAIQATDVVRVVVVLSDYKTSNITHAIGTLVIDGSSQQQLSSFRPFEIANLTPGNTKPVGLAHSRQQSMRFLIEKPGTYE